MLNINFVSIRYMVYLVCFLVFIDYCSCCLIEYSCTHFVPAFTKQHSSLCFMAHDFCTVFVCVFFKLLQCRVDFCSTFYVFIS